MPVIPGTKKDHQTIAKLKEEYLDYYEDCPKQGLAAQYICRDTDTITRWKGEDKDFAEMILKAEAKFARKHIKNVTAEWKLSRILGQHFKEPEQKMFVQVIPILSDTIVHTNDSNEEGS